MLPGPAAQRPPTAVSVALLLLAVAWLGLTAWFVLAAAITSAPFLGDRPTTAERAETARLLGRAALSAVGLPVVGLAVAVATRAPVGRWFYGVAVVVGLVLAVLLAPRPDLPRTPAPAGPRPCQELSGGDTRCPGG